MHLTTRTIAALLGALLATTAACSDDSSAATGPNAEANPALSAEDKALEAKGGTGLKAHDGAQILRATGNILAGVQQYRALLGDPNNGVGGTFAAGRREINWDGVPAVRTNTNDFPGNFFNVNSPRGAVFTTPGTGFRVSDNGFTDVNGAYAGAFNTFSPTRLFSAVGSTEIEVRFFLPGTTTPARVTGFGAVFAGVDRSRSATIEYYDAGGHRIETVAAPRAVDATGLSFAGVVFDAPVVASVRISAGDAPIGASAPNTSTGKTDLVVMDDFIYGEPRAMP